MKLFAHGHELGCQFACASASLNGCNQSETQSCQSNCGQYGCPNIEFTPVIFHQLLGTLSLLHLVFPKITNRCLYVGRRFDVNALGDFKASFYGRQFLLTVAGGFAELGVFSGNFFAECSCRSFLWLRTPNRNIAQLQRGSPSSTLYKHSVHRCRSDRE